MLAAHRNVLVCTRTTQELDATIVALAEGGVEVLEDNLVVVGTGSLTESRVKKLLDEGCGRFVVTVGGVTLDKHAAEYARTGAVCHRKLAAPVVAAAVCAVALEVLGRRFEAHTWPAMLKSLRGPPQQPGERPQDEGSRARPNDQPVRELVKAKLRPWIAAELHQQLGGVDPHDFDTLATGDFAKLFEAATALHARLRGVVGGGLLEARVARMEARDALRSEVGEALLLAVVRQMGRRCQNGDPQRKMRNAVKLQDLREAIAFITELDGQCHATAFATKVAAALSRTSSCAEYRRRMVLFAEELKPTGVATGAAPAELDASDDDDAAAAE